MCFISRRPFTDRVIKVIQYQKGLYDFYYTLVTLTTGYKYRLLLMHKGCTATRNTTLALGSSCVSSIARGHDVIPTTDCWLHSKDQHLMDQSDCRILPTVQ